MLFTEGEVEDALKELRKKQRYTDLLKITEVPTQDSTEEGLPTKIPSFPTQHL